MEKWSDEQWVKHIKSYLAERPNYSVRAMARDAGIDPTLMYRILSGKRKISLETRIKLEDFFKAKI